MISMFRRRASKTGYGDKATGDSVGKLFAALIKLPKLLASVIGIFSRARTYTLMLFAKRKKRKSVIPMF